MLKISANDAQLTVVACGPITSDRIDLPCEITLSEEFDGLAVTVVFKAGDVQRDVAMLGSPVHVPAECLEQAGEVLMVGIWAGDGSGRPTIPTVWASAGTIRTGVLPSGYDPDEPEPDWAAQVQQAAAQAVATANSVRADADAGVFDGEDGYSPSATVTQGDGFATITITDKDGTTTATVHDGADGRDGTDGADGYSPTATVTQTATGATISITDKSGTTTASVSNGTDGTDGTDGVDGFSPTVDVQAITGGHEVTITDADGAHSFEVMDGDPATPGSITDEMLASDGIKPQVAQLFGNQPTGTLSGTIDTASDAYAAPPMALTVDGVSTQAGTPTPDAPATIMSVDDLSLVMAGKNLFDIDKVIRTSANVTVEGTTITTVGTSRDLFTGTAGVNAAVTDLSKVMCLPAGTYTVSCGKTAGGVVSVRLVADDGTISDLINSTTSSTAWVGTFTLYDASHITIRGTNQTITNLQIELGSTATAYEPYTGHAVPLYDGTLRSLPDGTKDELHLSYLRTSTREGWAWYGREVTAKCKRLSLAVADMVDLVVGGNNTPGWTGVDTTDYSTSNSNVFYKTRCLCNISDGQDSASGEIAARFKYENRITLSTTYGYQYSTAEEWKTAHPDLTFVLDYPLLNPVTTQLDPIELPELPAPTCTVFCDGGSATPTYQMQYVQDTNLVIADLRAALADLATS